MLPTGLNEMRGKSKSMMLKIGEFAQLGQVSIVTLRHYDQYGLLKPAALDPDTGYRYYSLDQLARLHRILALKDLGFPLNEIARLLEDSLSIEQLQGMFRFKQAQIQQAIEAEQARLARIAVRLRQIEQEGSMSVYETRLKFVEPLPVASIRMSIAVDEDLEQQYERISAYLEQQEVPFSSPHMLLWYSHFETHENGIFADVELALPLRASLQKNEIVASRTLPGGLMACTVHTKNKFSLGQAHMSLHKWIKEHSYIVVGPPRQLHLQVMQDLDPAHWFTELQFPIAKRDARPASNQV